MAGSNGSVSVGSGGGGGITAGSASPGGSSFDIDFTGTRGTPLFTLPALTATPPAPRAPLMNIDIEAG
jgi:hypothetical protein